MKINKKTKRKSSVYKDKKGYIYYQTYTFFNSFDGRKKKRQHTITKGSSKSQITRDVELWDEFYDDIDKKFDISNPFTKPPTPLSRISQKFIEDGEKQVELGEMSPSTLRINRENINLFVRWFLDGRHDRNVHKISTNEIEEYKEHRRMCKSPTSGGRLSSNTIRINLRVVRSFFKWCVKHDYIERTPFTDDIELPSYTSRPPDNVPLGDDWSKLYGFIEKSIDYKPHGSENKILQKFNDNDWFKYVIYIMCNSGMRGGEVRILKWKKGKFDEPSQRKPYSYIDRDFNNIHIYFKGTYGVIPIIKSKIKPLLKQLSRSRGKNTYVFQSPITSEPYDKSIFNKMFRQLMVELGMGDKNYTPHSIRHSVVSHLVRNGHDIYTIQNLCRHKSIRTTMDIYSHLFNQDLENIMEKIGG